MLIQDAICGHRQFFILLVDHKLHIWDETESDGCCFMTSDGPFLSHEHDGSMSSYLFWRSIEKTLSRSTEVSRGLNLPLPRWDGLLAALQRYLPGLFMNPLLIVVAEQVSFPLTKS